MDDGGGAVVGSLFAPSLSRSERGGGKRESEESASSLSRRGGQASSSCTTLDANSEREVFTYKMFLFCMSLIKTYMLIAKIS